MCVVGLTLKIHCTVVVCANRLARVASRNDKGLAQSLQVLTVLTVRILMPFHSLMCAGGIAHHGQPTGRVKSSSQCGRSNKSKAGDGIRMIVRARLVELLTFHPRRESSTSSEMRAALTL